MALTVGMGLTVNVTEFDLVHPFGCVAVAVYVIVPGTAGLEYTVDNICPFI